MDDSRHMALAQLSGCCANNTASVGRRMTARFVSARNRARLAIVVFAFHTSSERPLPAIASP